MTKTFTYTINEVVPYINWIYFDYAWGLSGKSEEERNKLHDEAHHLLADLSHNYNTHAALGLFDANTDGDDIVIGNTRLPMLRQQHTIEQRDTPNLCLADFIRPITTGIPDRIGIFATTVDYTMEHLYLHDDYLRMLTQTLADRLAEATAEKLHEDVRKHIWGYAPDEQLTMNELHREVFQGIRPAVGYPSMPDTSMNFLLSGLIDMKGIGIRLTESGAMRPHASVSGLMIAHPKAQYFTLGKIGEDQLRDYADRRGLPIELVRRFLAGNLEYS